MGYGLKWLRATMRVVCGGRIAEAKAMEDVSSGAAQDIQQVTQLARPWSLEWGMSDKLGFVRYTGEDSKEMFMADRDYSDGDRQDHRRGGPPDRRRGVRRRERMLEEHWDQGRPPSPRRCSSTRRSGVSSDLEKHLWLLQSREG
jgi:hypothetical protein